MAAGRIKGITVEIGGDTTKLQTALKASTAKSRTHRASSNNILQIISQSLWKATAENVL